MEFSPSHDLEYYRELNNFIELSYVNDNFSLEGLFSVQNVSKLNKNVSYLLSKFDTSSLVLVPIKIPQPVNC
jgi:hypothetical protein